MDALCLALVGLLFLWTALRLDRITQDAAFHRAACRGSHSRLDRRLDVLDERVRFCSCRLEQQANPNPDSN